MKEQFVPYDIAVKLKEIGFKEKCFGSYWTDIEENNKYVDGRKKLDIYYHYSEIFEPDEDGGIINGDRDFYVSAPLWQQVFDWFREKHNILAIVYSNASGYLFEMHDAIGGTHRYDSGYTGPNDSGCWDSYDEARLECFNKVIGLVKPVKYQKK